MTNLTLDQNVLLHAASTAVLKKLTQAATLRTSADNIADVLHILMDDADIAQCMFALALSRAQQRIEEHT